MKSIVVFYSLEGNCKLIGNTIASTINSDVLELKLKKPVPIKGPMKFITGGRSAMRKASPELATIIPDLSDYELIIVGAPVWAGTFAPAIRTFASKAHIKDKKMAFFTCCASGPTEKCFTDMKALFEGNTVLSDISFVNPSTKDTENCINQAKIWAEKFIS
ncbi:MAG: flavodoxin family protein [Aminipila sp.]